MRANNSNENERKDSKQETKTSDSIGNQEEGIENQDAEEKVLNTHFSKM